MGVMRPLGDRVRRAPSLWRPENRLIPEPLVVLIQAWLQKRRQLIEALIHRIAEGKHVGRAYRPREPKPGAIPKPRAQIPPEKQLPPRVVGWINRMASEVNCHAAGLLHIACTPEMRAMIEASPQMARLWVPLLNSLGQPRPDWWPKPPPRPRRPRRPPPPPRPRRPCGQDPKRPEYDPVAAWLARFPPPPPAPRPPGMESSAPSIPDVPPPWRYERLGPQDLPIWRRLAQTAPPEPPLPARRRTRQDALNECWAQLSRRRPIGE
jgi:hypothetical protein